MTAPHEHIHDLIDLIDASPTPFHAVSDMVGRLEERGFSPLDESASWALDPGSRYYLVRNGSSLIAWVQGADHPGSGFRLVGAHTDSPNLRLKPRPEVGKEGYRQLGLEVYGGVLLTTWLDRDLSIAGRVHLKESAQPLMYRDPAPRCRIPNLAIHLDREINTVGLKINPQDHLPVVVGLEGDSADPRWFRHYLATGLGVDPDSILSFDLMLYDTQLSTISGLDDAFVHAPRLDNLASCHAGLTALLDGLDEGPTGPGRVVAFYDNEEVGSETAQGAASNFLAVTLERIMLSAGSPREDFHRALARSLFISADMAHAVHPNYVSRHDPQHMPKLNGGPVLKVNANQRYATSGESGSRFLRIANDVGVETQTFVARTDLGCGSTIGPITAARLGMPTVDVGNPMLSMHSIREMAGTRDHHQMIQIMQNLFVREIA